MSDLTDRLAHRVECDPPLEPNDLILDGVVLLRVLAADGGSRIEIVHTEGTDGLVATGIIETASRIGVASWVAQVAEDE